jgi:two-component system sensor histidine kinase KdpD
MKTGPSGRGLAAPFALFAGFAALFAVGTVAAALHGRLSATGVLIASAIVVGAVSAAAEPLAALPLAAIGWLTAVGFSRPPYSDLHPTGPYAARAVAVMLVTALVAAGAGYLVRWQVSRSILEIMGASTDAGHPDREGDGTLPASAVPPEPAAGGPVPIGPVPIGPVPAGPVPAGPVPTDAGAAGLPPTARPLPSPQPSPPAQPAPLQSAPLQPAAAQPAAPGQRRPAGRSRGWEHGAVAALVADGIDARRRLLGLAAAAVAIPALTALLMTGRGSLSLTDDLLIYLVMVVALAVIGGFWPAVLAAVAASLLLNWFFTPPLHTFTVDAPQDLLALLLFVTVAVAVSSVVHLAARRSVQASRSRDVAGALLGLAQTVLGGSDTPAAVLAHLVHTLGGYSELKEQVGGRWVPIASAGGAPQDEPVTRLTVRADLVLEVRGQTGPATPGLLAGFAAQAAAALDRERLRTQAAQAEALAEGNRMRTALLAAVSHDLRTPLASIKASVSSLRQRDVHWSLTDTEALLATIEQNADRLDGLIGNLLDMSRLHTGSLQPFLRPTTIDEVAPVALHGLDAAAGVRLEVPDGLPLVLADPGLLERVLANLFSNALQHSPAAQPPALRASRLGGSVVLEVVDHGKGVPDTAKTLIFEPFQRLEAKGVGVGLGLAVAKGFTEAMGGSIGAADTPGGGLTVRVTLPAASREGQSMVGADS